MSEIIRSKLLKTTCPFCKKPFDRKQGLLHHVRLMHTNKRKLQHRHNTSNKSTLKAPNLGIHHRLRPKNTTIDARKEVKPKKKISDVYKSVVTDTLYSSDSDCEYELLQTIIKVNTIRNCVHTCQFCSKKFINSSNLERHVSTKHRGSSSVLDDTEMHSSNADKMQIDDKDVVPEIMLVDKDMMEDKMQIDDLSTDNAVSVEISSNPDNTASNSRESVTPNRKLICRFCNATFKEISELITHRRLHYRQSLTKLHTQSSLDPSFTRRYGCNLCKRSYSQKIYLENHMRLHESGKLYETFEDPNEEKYLCTYCGKQFGSSSHFSLHVKLHSDGKKYLCSFCGKAFALERYLINHQRTHTKEKLFSCDYCRKRFVHKGTLVEHLRIHAGIKPHECTICDKKFTYYSGLAQHLRTHTDEKKHVCNVCGKSFRSKSNYQGHIRTHTGDKPFVCTICDKRFALSNTLVVHYRTHSGVRPYKCEVCEKGFIKSSNLKQHLKVHVADKTERNNKVDKDVQESEFI